MLDLILDFYDGLWSEELEYIYGSPFDHNRRLAINAMMDDIEAWFA